MELRDALFLRILNNSRITTKLTGIGSKGLLLETKTIEDYKEMLKDVDYDPRELVAAIDKVRSMTWSGVTLLVNVDKSLVTYSNLHTQNLLNEAETKRLEKETNKLLEEYNKAEEASKAAEEKKRNLLDKLNNLHN